MNLLPLALMWLWGRRNAAPSLPRAPAWPTAASPPPMPAFEPQTGPPPVPDAAATATPLAALHREGLSQPGPKPKRGPAQASPAQAARAAVTRTAKSTAKRAAHSALSSVLSPRGSGGTPTTNIGVSELHKILASRGVYTVPPAEFGLYGPKTARAWTALAKSKGLPSGIARVNAKTARVAAQTYDVLAVPAIP